MDCEWARDGLWPPEKPKLAGDDVLAAREHVDNCPGCQAFFHQDRELLGAYDRLRDVKAPRPVRERIFDVLARERAGRNEVDRLDEELVRSWERRSWRWGLATVALLVVGGLAWTGRTPAVPETATEAVFVEDYLRRAVGEEQIVTTNAAEVTRFLTRELGMALAPLEVDGLSVKRAEICLLEGQRGAMIVYSEGGRSISHYIIPRESVARAPETSERLEEAFRGEGMPSVVTWATAHLEQALVGTVPSARLVEIARSGATY